MQYVIYKRFKDSALCGPVNLKATLPCWESEGIIYYEGKPLCFAASENALCHFARDDDGKGLLRGKLIGDIKRRLAKRDGDYQKRWDRFGQTSSARSSSARNTRISGFGTKRSMMQRLKNWNTLRS